jgi:hypothetical protein
MRDIQHEWHGREDICRPLQLGNAFYPSGSARELNERVLNTLYRSIIAERSNCESSGETEG